jgi:hypothetical protein
MPPLVACFVARGRDREAVDLHVERVEGPAAEAGPERALFPSTEVAEPVKDVPAAHALWQSVMPGCEPAARDNSTIHLVGRPESYSSELDPACRGPGERRRKRA